MTFSVAHVLMHYILWVLCNSLKTTLEYCINTCLLWKGSRWSLWCRKTLHLSLILRKHSWQNQRYSWVRFLPVLIMSSKLSPSEVLFILSSVRVDTQELRKSVSCEGKHNLDKQMSPRLHHRGRFACDRWFCGSDNSLPSV